MGNTCQNINLAELSGDEFLTLLDSATPEELKQISESLPAPVADNSRTNILTRLLSVNGELHARDVFFWWESRRPRYNVLVGLCGLPGLLLLLHKGLIFMLVPIVWYAIAANVCYTGGSIAELAARQLFGERARDYGQI